jgi:hypothetical protein
MASEPNRASEPNMARADLRARGFTEAACAKEMAVHTHAPHPLPSQALLSALDVGLQVIATHSRYPTHFVPHAANEPPAVHVQVGSKGSEPLVQTCTSLHSERWWTNVREARNEKIKGTKRRREILVACVSVLSCAFVCLRQVCAFVCVRGRGFCYFGGYIIGIASLPLIVLTSHCPDLVQHCGFHPVLYESSRSVFAGTYQPPPIQ